MFVYVCVRICMYVHVCVCMCRCMCVCVCALYECTYARTNADVLSAFALIVVCMFGPTRI